MAYALTFIHRERIIEYCLPPSDGALAKLSVKEFVRSVAARSPAPGGGSVSALLGALVRDSSISQILKSTNGR